MKLTLRQFSELYPLLPAARRMRLVALAGQTHKERGISLPAAAAIHLRKPERALAATERRAA